MMDPKEKQWLLRDKYQGVESPEYFADCERLDHGEPLGYVIRWVPFLNTKIRLDSKPLIPRPETEFWTAKAIKRMKDRVPDVTVLDLCAGSGAIGVAVGKALPFAHIDFAEIDPAHRTTITENICDNGIEFQNTRVLIGNLFAPIPPGTRYGFILTNPPYIDPALDRTEPSVKGYEPHLALYGGQSGMELIERIITEARSFLTERGELWIEHEPEQSISIATLAREHGYASCQTERDQFGVERYSILTL
jgi:release factor glutamine methyltransferase